MKLSGRPIETERMRMTARSAAEGSKSGFFVGKRINCEIVSAEGDRVVLEHNGKLINARNTSSETLYSGTSAEFEVMKADDGTIEIRPLAFSSLSDEKTDMAFLKKTMLSLGLPESGENVEILSKMLKMGNLISKGAFDSAKLEFLQLERLSSQLFVSSESEGNYDLLSHDPMKLMEALALSPKDLLSNKGSLDALIAFVKSLPMFSEAFSNMSLGGAEVVKSDAKVPEFIPPEAQTSGTPVASVQTSAQGGDKVIFQALNTFSEQIENESVPTDQGKASQVRGSGASSEIALDGDKLTDMKELLKSGDVDVAYKLLSKFQSVSSNRDTLLNTMVFLNKMGVKPSIVNISLASIFFLEDPGMTDAVFQLGDLGDDIKPELKEALDIFKSNVLMKDRLEDISPDDVEYLTKVYENLSQKLSEDKVIDREKVGNNPTLRALEQNARLAMDLKPVWQTVIIPLMGTCSVDDMEMYVKKDGAGQGASRRDSDDRLVYLSLKTDNIERIKVRIDYKRDSIKLMFITQPGEIESYVEKQISDLSSRLSKLTDKYISVSVGSDARELSLADFELISVPSSVSKIDVKV